MSKKTRTLVVGIDGGDWSYLRPFLHNGHLPILQDMISEGVHGLLESTMPPVTPVAWTSFATGKNPGKHGIFSWLWRRPNTWEFLPFSGSQRVGTPWWTYLNQQGIRVGLVNIPMTYPPTPIEGFIVCGFGAPASANNLTYPASLQNQLAKNFAWSGDVAFNKIPLSDGGWQAFEEGRQIQSKNVQSALYLAEKQQVDVLAINLMLLDHCNHLASNEAVLKEAVIQCDRHLSELINGFQPDNIMIFSDHGSRRVVGSFLLGLWLHDHGYLTWKRRNKLSKADLNWLLINFFQQHLGWVGQSEKLSRGISRELLWILPNRISSHFWRSVKSHSPLLYMQYLYNGATDFSQSIAHLEDWGSFYLNTLRHDSEGFVPRDAYNQLHHDLAEQLFTIVDPHTKQLLFSEIYGRNEIYQGPQVEFAPDLILDYFASRWSMAKGIPSTIQSQSRYFAPNRQRWQGDHTRQGIFILSGDSILSSQEFQAAHIMDIPTTLLYLYDCSIPDDWDGAPLLNFMKPDFVNNQLVTFQPGDDPIAVATDYDYSEQDIVQISEHLKALGYLDQ